MTLAILYRDAELARQVEREVGALEGVRRARASSLTATVLAEVDADADVALGDLPTRIQALVLQLRTSPRAAPETAVARKVHQRELGAPALGWLAGLQVSVRVARRSVRAESVAHDHESAVGHQDDETPRWHAMSAEDVLAKWHSGERGLSDADVAERRARYGANELTPSERRSELGIFLGQLKSTPVALLAGSALLSIATGGLADAAAIFTVLTLNAAIGYVTESSAERTIRLLESEPAELVKVRRDGGVRELAAADVVPGDLLVLEPGSRVAADARILESRELRVDESPLTGESLPVLKGVEVLEDEQAPLGERADMVFQGTAVTGGSGLAIVVATGEKTELGRIQTLAGTVERPETPLQQQLRKLGTQLVIASAGVCGAVFVVGALRGRSLLEMLKTSVSLAVAAVPEGLPTVAISTLALGIRRMRRLNVHVRQLEAVETLGSVQVFCFDKTGTITENQMAVVAAFAAGRRLRLEADRFCDGPGSDRLAVGPDLEQLLRILVLASEAEVLENGAETSFRGSPTEVALVRCALANGIRPGKLRSGLEHLHTRHRTQTRARMDLLYANGSSCLLAVKGRPADVVKSCTHFLAGHERVPLDDGRRKQIEHENERMAGQALRVLGVAYAELSHEAANGVRENDDADEPLVWLGLVGLADPPRAGVNELFERFHAAGIETMLITGDQSATAHAVARQVGLARQRRINILDSKRLEEVPPEALTKMVRRVQVFSRVNPAHKLGIVQALQRGGAVVAMTGDGVNDGPALKSADVGVAMGQGTGVARDVADVVLENDELSTMLSAVEQGRTIYDDIRKAVRFILATNASEILLTFVQVATNLGQSLTPMQLLWINIFTDVFPELALAMEPPESDVLQRPPRRAGRPMFDRADLLRAGRESLVLTSGALAGYGWGHASYGPGPRANTLAFLTLTSAQLLHALSARSDRGTIFHARGRSGNRTVLLTVAGSLALQSATVLVPGLRRVLGTAPLGFADWLVVGAGAVAPLIANESWKPKRAKASDVTIR